MKRIDHVNIVVSDLERAASFFEAFGFSSTEPAELAGEWISSIVGLKDVCARYVVLSDPGSSTNIELIAYVNPPPKPPDPDIGAPNHLGLRHIAFEVEDIESEVSRLRQVGVAFKSEVRVYPKTGKKLVYFHGPDGILLEFAEYPKRDRGL